MGSIVKGYGWNHELDGKNKDLSSVNAESYFEREIESSLPDPFIEKVEWCGPNLDKTLYVWRDDKLIGGLKSRACEGLVLGTQATHLAYVSQHTGAAPTALAEAASKHGKGTVLFSACRSKMTVAQCRPFLFPNVEQRWYRIVRMPMLNRKTEKWCKDYGVEFVRPGLADTPLVTAAIAQAARKALQSYRELSGRETIPQVWCVSSTGTLTRALQIGIAKDADSYHVVPVARNMKNGELGESNIHLEPLKFDQLEQRHNLPPFPSVANYDAKGWKHFNEQAPEDSLFVNVGADPSPSEAAKYLTLPPSQESWLEWNDERAFEQPPKPIQ